MHQVLSPILNDYQKTAAVQLHINTSTARLDIVKGEADVAIRAGGKPPEPLVGRRLCQVESTIYYSKKMRGVKLEKLDDYPWICADESLNHFESSKWLRQKGLLNSAVMVTNSRLNMLNLLKSGAGIGVLSCYLGDSEPSLCRLMPPPAEWRSDLWILTRADLRHVPRIKMLFDMVYQGTRHLVPLFEGVAGGLK
jgi:DNA-binding transcriptional LysR family regulator